MWQLLLQIYNAIIMQETERMNSVIEVVLAFNYISIMCKTCLGIVDKHYLHKSPNKDTINAVQFQSQRQHFGAITSDE